MTLFIFLGGYIGAVILEENGHKSVFDVFLDSKGNVLRVTQVFSFKGSSYEPNILFDSKRKHFYFLSTVEGGGIEKDDVYVTSDLPTIVLHRVNGSGAYDQPNEDSLRTMVVVGLTNNTFAKMSGYFSESTDR